MKNSQMKEAFERAVEREKPKNREEDILLAIVYHASPQTNLQIINPGRTKRARCSQRAEFIIAHAFLGRGG